MVYREHNPDIDRYLEISWSKNKNPEKIRHVPDPLKTKKMCEHAFEKYRF